jgi:hypothetical protein
MGSLDGRGRRASRGEGSGTRNLGPCDDIQSDGHRPRAIHPTRRPQSVSMRGGILFDHNCGSLTLRGFSSKLKVISPTRMLVLLFQTHRMTVSLCTYDGQSILILRSPVCCSYSLSNLPPTSIYYYVLSTSHRFVDCPTDLGFVVFL